MSFSAERHGPFVVLRDLEGRQHTLRGTAIIGVTETDGSSDESALIIQGGRLLLVDASLEESSPGSFDHGCQRWPRRRSSGDTLPPLLRSDPEWRETRRIRCRTAIISPSSPPPT